MSDEIKAPVWQPWSGGDKPPFRGVVWVKLRNGQVGHGDGGWFRWSVSGSGSDIIAWAQSMGHDLRPVDPQIPAADESVAPPSADRKPTAPDLLDAAAGHMRDRAATYDQPSGERSMGRTVAAFNAITGRDLTESEGFLLMQILKDVRDRQRSKPHRDSLEDGIAYAALKAEARISETNNTKD